jgi:hypothetical protein
MLKLDRFSSGIILAMFALGVVALALLASVAVGAPYYNPYQQCCWHCDIPPLVTCPAGDIPWTVTVMDSDSVAVAGVRVDLFLWARRYSVIRGTHLLNGTFVPWPDSLWIVANGPSALCRDTIPDLDRYMAYSDSAGRATFRIKAGGSVVGGGYSLWIDTDNQVIHMGPILSVDMVDEFGRVAGDSLYAPATCVVGLSDLTFLTPQFKGAPRDGYWENDSTYIPADSIYTPLADFIRDEPRSRIMLSDVTFWTPHLQGAHSSGNGQASASTVPVFAMTSTPAFAPVMAVPDSLGMTMLPVAAPPDTLGESLTIDVPDVTIRQKRKWLPDKVVHQGTE